MDFFFIYMYSENIDFCLLICASLFSNFSPVDMYHFYNKTVRYIILSSFFRNLSLDRWHVQEDTTLWMEPGFVWFLLQTDRQDGCVFSIWLGRGWQSQSQEWSWGSLLSALEKHPIFQGTSPCSLHLQGWISL